MRCAPLLCGLLTVVAAYFATGAAVVAEDRPAATGPAGGWQPGPDLRPGEIVIKRTGTKRVAAARPAPRHASVVTDPPAELSHDGPGPRTVTIGYMVRDEIETGWGPQVHCPAPNYGRPYSYCDSYGYNSYLPSYGTGFGSSCGVGPFFGTRSYYAPIAPAGRAARWR